MTTPPRVVIVGRGRLGGSVAVGLERAGWIVTPVERGFQIPEDARIVWLTVPDGSIAGLASIVPAAALVVHSAGSLGPEVLAPRRGAVLHPLMTFPAPGDATVNCTVEGHPDALRAALMLASSLGWTVIGGVGDRVRYHAAACLASGHLAACFADAAALFASATGIPEASARAVLEPLAAASLARVVAAGPAALTGPAARKDLATIAAHRAALPPELLELYDAGTHRIAKLRDR